MAKKKDNLEWWREARFGLFIHWGVYAVPAGIWEDEDIPGIGEWIMHRAEIPVEKYEKFAKRFDPVKFDAKLWVSMAKDAGMKYIVITSKHHDGFAMYDSANDDYNIVAATPYARDPMKDLAKECKRAGLKLCFYYSQDQDWHEPGGRGNTWDYGSLTDKDFAGYLKSKVVPQLKEILTQYGPIGLIWFDTPGIITQKQSLALKRLVHRLQPDCLVSGRVGHNVGDYSSMGDNMIPAGPVKGAWETPATMNDTWGFKKNDKNWKSTKTLLTLLVDLASKGVNYLLNVGPTAQGVIPAASVKRLQEMGQWMKVNGEAIYGAQPNPFPYELPWGRITSKPGKLFLHIYEWPRKRFVLKGLRSAVSKVYLLSDTKTSIAFEQDFDREISEYRLELTLPQPKPDKNISVVVVEVDGDVKVDKGIAQQSDGSILLPAHLAEIQGSPKETDLGLDRSSILTGWKHTGTRISWIFKVTEPGAYLADLSTAALGRPRVWSGGQSVELSVAGPLARGASLKTLAVDGSTPKKSYRRKLKCDEMLDTPRTQHIPEALSRIGTLKLKERGVYRIEMVVSDFGKKAKDGITVSFLQLRPAPTEK